MAHRASKTPKEPASEAPGLGPRLAAARAIADVVAHGRRLDECFLSRLAPKDEKGARDMALARSIATVAVRRLGTIRHALAALLEKGYPRKAEHLEWILIAAAAQILFLDLPDHAAVDLAVRAARLDSRTAPFANLINAVLRNLIRRRHELLAPADPLERDTPPWLAKRWIKAYGEATARAIACAHMREPPLDVTVKSDPATWAERLDGVVLPTGSVRVRARAPIPELPGFGEGEWWVQDAAAALPARLLHVRPGERVLDMCAAPGGKTAQLALSGAKVTAVDRSPERLKTLSANLQRLGLQAEIAPADAAVYEASPFDAVLVDAPCMATGTIRRHPDVVWTKTPNDLEKLAELQARLLDRAAILLRPEGRIVYCVCSLEPEEGEAQANAFLRRHPELSRDPIDSSKDGAPPEFITPEGDLRSLPCCWPADDARLAGLDGFFAARFVKRAHTAG